MIKLYTINRQVFVELAQDYLIYLGEVDTIAKLSPQAIVLLANMAVYEHTNGKVH